MAGQLAQRAGQCLVAGGQVVSHATRGGFVQFRHVQVKPNGKWLVDRNFVDQQGQAITGPGPLPHAFEAALVNFHNGDRLAQAVAGHHMLVAVKQGLARRGKRRSDEIKHLRQRGALP